MSDLTFAPGSRASTLDRRGHIASFALALLLIAVSVYAVWASQATSAAAERAILASHLSDDFVQVARAVALEKSLERNYRLEPGPDVRRRFDTAAQSFVDSVSDIRRDGSAEDVALGEDLLARHATFLDSVHRLFDAVDDGNTALSLRIDNDEVDPIFEAIDGPVTMAAQERHQLAQAELHALRNLENTTSRVTPPAFFLAVLLTSLLAWVMRGNRRLLAIERETAVYDSLHDSLTGLANRTLLSRRLEGALDTGTTTGLLLIDLDRFKDVNDTFGHHYGDELLSQVGQRLIEALPESATVARLGGDEFAVLLPSVDSTDEATDAATLVGVSLRRAFSVEEVELDVDASVGVVVSGEHGRDVATLLQRADIAMYSAKETHSGMALYNPVLDAHSPDRLTLVGELREALDRRELILHYQPKLAVSSGALLGAEALVRWDHPQRGLVFPDAFIPLAEHTGLIGPLTTYVMDAALQQARVWADAGTPLMVSVNLSARNLLDTDLPAEVAGLLASHGVPASLLTVEVTESAIMLEPVRACQVLEAIAALGVVISIDDFGVGYTSLGQLRNLPVTELKIDRSFVMAMNAHDSNALIVSSVIDLGHNLGLTLVAEGVEDEEALETLRGLGCDVAQGYLMCRPVPVSEFDVWRAGQTVPVPVA